MVISLNANPAFATNKSLNDRRRNYKPCLVHDEGNVYFVDEQMRFGVLFQKKEGRKVELKRNLPLNEKMFTFLGETTS